MTPNIIALVAELRELEAKATKAPWATGLELYRFGWDGCIACVIDGRHRVLLNGNFNFPEDAKHDAALCIAARNTLPTLLDIIEQQGREIERLRGAIEDEVARLTKHADHRTHYEGCEKDHAACAALKRMNAAMKGAGQ